MFAKQKILKAVALICVVHFACAAPLWAQTAVPGLQKPVMENVFFNVVWGSVLGAVLGGAGAVVNSANKTAPDHLSDAVGVSTTYGGIVGLGVGLWLAFSGVSFDPQRSLFFSDNSVPPPNFAIGGEPPFVLETGQAGSHRITGFRARVFEFRF